MNSTAKQIQQGLNKRRHDKMSKLVIGSTRYIKKDRININDLEKHLQAQFTKEMNWKNYGTYWVVDHVIPISKFKTIKELAFKANALDNLQPVPKGWNTCKAASNCDRYLQKFNVEFTDEMYEYLDGVPGENVSQKIRYVLENYKVEQ